LVNIFSPKLDILVDLGQSQHSPPMPNDQPHTQKFKFMYLKDYEQRPEEGPAASSDPPPSLMQARQCSLPIAKFNIYFLRTNL